MAPPHIVFGGGVSSYSSSDDDSFVVRSHSRVRRHSRPRVVRENLEVPRRGRVRASSVGPQGRDGNIFIVNEARSPSRERSHSHVRARPKLFAEDEALIDLDEQMEQLRRHRRPRSRSSHSPRLDIEEHLRLDRLRLLERREEAAMEERNRKLDEQLLELQRERDTRIRERERELDRERDRVRDRESRDRRGRHRDHSVSRRDIENELQIERLLQMQHDLEAQRYIDDQLIVRRAQAREEEEAEKEHEKRIREKIETERTRKEAEEAERREYEAKLKKQAVDEYNRIEAEKKQKEKKDKEKADREFEERARATLAKSGYTDDQITAILKGEEKPKSHAHPAIKPTFIKVSSLHISPETLDFFHIPWEWDDRDKEFILIKRWITDDEQEELFEHTKTLRHGQKLLIAPAPPQPQVGVRVRDRDEMYLVRTRKKSPRRASGWGLW
ncbi:hypothetical protein I7I50_11869 [Histoplasma capsulatum G186AR]|uniref:Uncharacterized protein n=1 Tax=Ajellomyces capsulatus TaxID=5037 RepID=A0A8H7Y747_AJECA|nr:hypothetical protein I7I52_10945 [Histoplasma capsulatum]QSS70290.1 hypothetical protein I7I50_11869 [Histoplasma capsulatum G186AR]